MRITSIATPRRAPSSYAFISTAASIKAVHTLPASRSFSARSRRTATFGLCFKVALAAVIPTIAGRAIRSSSFITGVKNGADVVLCRYGNTATRSVSISATVCRGNPIKSTGGMVKTVSVAPREVVYIRI